MSLEDEAEQLVESCLETARRMSGDPNPASVTCECGHVVFDGEAIRARCVKPAKGIALCRCKRWVGVPINLW